MCEADWVKDSVRQDVISLFIPLVSTCTVFILFNLLASAVI